MNRASVTPSLRARAAPDDDGIAGLDEAVEELESQWGRGRSPCLESLWKRFAPGGSAIVLAALVKAELRLLYARGERPDVAFYLARFPSLRGERERVVSLVYEEFCLREERGERPDPDSFCARYDPWRDSLQSQLRYHRMLSLAIGAAPSSTALPSAGGRFRSFRLRSVLGQGGSGRVFLAHDEALGDREVALKLTTDRGREPAIQGRLDHAHIVPVLSVTDDPETGLRGLCMPYRPGLSLDEVIRRVDPAGRPRPASAFREAIGPAAAVRSWGGFPASGTFAEGAAWIASVVARALAYAHAQGVLHRDVKPANVLLTARDGPQLLDFNLAHAPHAADRAEAALRGGTLPYMAPEQLAAFLDPALWDAVGPSADVYALGLLLRELLTGRRPEAPDEAVPLPRAIRELLDLRASGFGSVRVLNPDVPHALEAILARCLAPEPTDRYSGAAALAQDLERFVSHREPVEARNPSLRERAANLARRWRRGGQRAAAAAAALALAAFLAVKLAPDGAEDLLKKADSRLTRGDVAGALEQVDGALARDPNSSTALALRAHLRDKSGRRAEGLKDLDRAIALVRPQAGAARDSLLAKLLHQRGAMAYPAGLRDEAEASYKEALHLAPVLHTARAGLARIEEDRGHYLEAKEQLDKALFVADSLGTKSDKAMYLQKRAAVEVNYAASLLKGEPTGPSPADDLAREADRAKAAHYYGEALRDASAARGLVTPSPRAAAVLDCIEAGAWLSLGDLAFDRGDRDESTRAYGRAAAHAESARRRPEGQAVGRQILDQLNRRLRRQNRAD